MSAVPDGTRLEVLSREECFELLASVSIGRIAVAPPGQPPLVLPVNYALDGEVVVFRTDPGAKLDLLHGHPASFEVDVIDPVHRRGWSVLVQGLAYETSPADPPVAPWVPGPKEHWVRVFPGIVTGRRIRLPEVKLDSRGYL